MKYNLKKVRLQYGLSSHKFARLCGLSDVYYELYESKGEIPCKYIYRLTKKLDDFPVPEDFLYYTSVSLSVNMQYHHMMQKKVAEAFGVKQQTISKYVNGAPFLMYEWKGKFLNTFKPFIITTDCLCMDGGNKTTKKAIPFETRGNIMSTERHIAERHEIEQAKQMRRSPNNSRYKQSQSPAYAET